MKTLAQALRHLSREEWDEGRAALTELVAAEPHNADAWAYLSGVLIARSDAAGATDAAERALTLDPDGFAPNMKAGELALRLGDLPEAERLFVQALRAEEPGSPGAAAAKRALVIVRERSRRSITHTSTLPRLRSPLGWLRRKPRAAEGTR